MSRRARICPACQRPFPPPLIVRGPIRQRLIEILLNRPDGVALSELVDLIYSDDPAGGPLTARNSLNVIAHRANKQLSEQGYRIESTWRGRGARYRLVRIDDGQSRSAMTTIDEIFRGYRAAEQRILSARRGGIAPDDFRQQGPKDPYDHEDAESEFDFDHLVSRTKHR
jgi:hypothetical protein